MKKVFFSLVVLLLLSNCVLIDTLGLNVVTPTIKGSEAKNQILTSALIGAASTGSTTTLITAIATYNIQTLKDSKFYDKKDVDDCSDAIALYNALLSSRANGIAVGGFLCDPIREHKILVDWPIRLF